MPLQDPQQHAVYEWQRSYVETRVARETMGKDETAILVARVSGLLGFPRPQVIYLNAHVACRAHMRKNTIEIAPWGRERHVVLHELAHFGSWQHVLRGDSPHGAMFVTVAIALFTRYLGLPVDYLIESAASHGLLFHEDLARGPIGAEIEEDFAGSL